MTPEEILALPSRVLAQADREFYFDNGYLLVPEVISPPQVETLLQATDEWVEKSKAIEKSDAIFDLEPGHSASHPRLRRLSSPVVHDRRYWEYAKNSIVADIVADLVGPDVKFHHSKLNFKWAQGGEEVKWHQDIQYWPHTNYSPLTVGVYLHDVGPDQGPLAVIPGSHEGPLYDQYNEKDQWVGCISEADLPRVGLEHATYLMGKAGSVTIHNCRLVHGSKPNKSDLGRPLLLNTFAAADAFTYTPNPLPSAYDGMIVRGSAARRARHDPRPCQIPPDWSGGYSSLFALQQEETWDDT
ncbi:MAG: phytanoyl-CoA dioxygenase family protein [Gammaproteobacteria bacterium]|nr:phytanoyl-CoA dioxygenase family protein [Gammaproteobacteria bacterium]